MSSTTSPGYTWTLEAYEYHGNLWLKWRTTAPFRAQQGQIHVYNSGFPSNPQDQTKEWTWDNIPNSPWDTGLKWGIGWSCAWIAQTSPPNEHYVYIVKVVTDATMGPDVAKP
jgi:hypothetical protein